jgi:hypothetical protein
MGVLPASIMPEAEYYIDKPPPVKRILLERDSGPCI